MKSITLVGKIHLPIGIKGRAAPKFPAPITFVCCECTCGDFEWRKDWLYEIGHFMGRFASATQVMVSTFGQDRLGNMIAQTITDSGHKHEVTMTFNSGEPSPWICKHIITAFRLWARRKHEARHVLIHWANDPKVAQQLKWAKHQQGDDFKPLWYRLDRNVFVVIWD